MLVATIVPTAIFLVPARADAQTAFASGDVFLSAGAGTVAQYRPPASSGRTDTLASGYTSSDAGGMCFDALGNLYFSATSTTPTLAKFSPNGALISGNWGPHTAPAGGQGTGCTVDASGNVYVATMNYITKLNSSGTQVGQWALTGVGGNGINSIGLKRDQCTLLYDDFSNRVRALNVCTGTQLADFATGLIGTCYEMVVRSDDSVVLACDEYINSLSSSGSVASSWHIGNYAASFTSVAVIGGSNTVWIGDYINRNMRVLDVGTGGTSNLFSVDVRPWLSASYYAFSSVDGPLTANETLGGSNGCSPHAFSAIGCRGKPIHTGTGNFWHTWSDIDVPGRGVPISQKRTYNSQASSSDAPFGYGWSFTYGISLSISGNDYTIKQENGAQVKFTKSGTDFIAPARANATLTQSGSTYTFTRNKNAIYTFDSGGLLTSAKDLNNYTTTITRPNSTTLKVVDAASSALTFTLTGTHITSLSDPTGRTMAFTYDGSGNLTQATDVGGGKTTFTYDSSHQMLTMRDPKYFGDTTTVPSPVTTNHYDGSGRVDWQTDELGRQMSFDYTSIPGSTKVTDPAGNVTLDTYQSGVRTSYTKGYGSATPSTWSFAYDPYTLGITSVVDPISHTTSMTYDSAGNRLSTTDALGHRTTSTYNALNEPTSVVDALANTSNMTYDSAGNILTSTKVRSEPTPAVNETTTYTYGDGAHPGDVTQVSNPLGQQTNFTYNTNGDLASTTDADGYKTTFNYNSPTSIGWVLSSVSPKGNVSGGTPSQYTTTYDHDAFGRVTATKDPMWNATWPTDHRISTTYDANGNVTSSTDGKGVVTNYSYDAANEPTTTTRPDSTTLVNAYWADGSLKSQTDGRAKVTNYAYDAQGRLSSVTDPLGRITSYAYDGAGNQTNKIDPGGSCTGTVTGCTTYSYDNANRQTGIGYSDPATHAVTYGYDNANKRTSMLDGTGTTSYSYDSLSRLTSTTNGASQTTSYGYDRASRQTTLTYPGNKTLTRTYDSAGRMTNIADWAGHNTIYTYDANGNMTNGALKLNSTTTAANQISAYNAADQIVNNKYDAGYSIGEFVANRNGAGQLTDAPVWGDIWLSQAEKTYSYDQVNRLASTNSANTAYDSGDNPTTLLNGSTQTFDNGNQLATSSRNGGTTYSYDTRGNRTSDTPTATNALPKAYGYDQANRLTSASSNTTPAVSYQSAVMADSPTGYWRLNEAPGSPVLDSSGNANSGSTSGWVTGGLEGAVKGDPGNKAMSFWNNGGEAWFPYVPINYSSTGDNTVEFNIRWNGGNGQIEAPFTWGSQYGLRFNNGSFGFSTKADGSDIYGIDASMLNQRWAHVTAVFRNGSVTASKLYINGVLQTLTQRTGTPSPVSAWDYAQLAGDGNGAQHFNGRIDELSVYSGALSQSRITAHYNATNSFSATYVYDGNGLRQSKNVNGTTTNFTWDTSSSIPRLLSDGTNKYLYGPDGQPFAQLDSSDNITWLAHDTQGNTRMLLRGDDGASIASWDYDAYGNATIASGFADTSLKFQGQYQDTETGLLYLRARYQDPQTNQFLTVDPLSAMTQSRYGYAANDGVNYGDPSGLMPDWFNRGAAALHETFVGNFERGAVVTHDTVLGGDYGASGTWSACVVGAGVVPPPVPLGVSVSPCWNWQGGLVKPLNGTGRASLTGGILTGTPSAGIGGSLGYQSGCVKDLEGWNGVGGGGIGPLGAEYSHSLNSSSQGGTVSVARNLLPIPEIHTGFTYTHVF